MTIPQVQPGDTVSVTLESVVNADGYFVGGGLADGREHDWYGHPIKVTTKIMNRDEETNDDPQVDDMTDSDSKFLEFETIRNVALLAESAVKAREEASHFRNAAMELSAALESQSNTSRENYHELMAQYDRLTMVLFYMMGFELQTDLLRSVNNDEGNAEKLNTQELGEYFYLKMRDRILADPDVTK